nr:hypothetical protein NCPCFENI_01317 [Cupriavidus sp.]
MAELHYELIFFRDLTKRNHLEQLSSGRGVWYVLK